MYWYNILSYVTFYSSLHKCLEEILKAKFWLRNCSGRALSGPFTFPRNTVRVKNNFHHSNVYERRCFLFNVVPFRLFSLFIFPPFLSCCWLTYTLLSWKLFTYSLLPAFTSCSCSFRCIRIFYQTCLLYTELSSYYYLHVPLNTSLYLDAYSST